MSVSPTRSAASVPRIVCVVDSRVAHASKHFLYVVKPLINLLGVSILRVLKQKDQQEGDHVGHGVDQEFSAVRVSGRGAQEQPQTYERDGGSECSFGPKSISGSVRELCES